MKFKFAVLRRSLLLVLLTAVVVVQMIPSWGVVYTEAIYPVIATNLIAFSNLFPFALGDLLVFLSVVALFTFPFYARKKQHSLKYIVGREVELLLLLYVWLYMAWGLNYSQPHFYKRTQMPVVQCDSVAFNLFAHTYIQRLNAAYRALQNSNEDDTNTLSTEQNAVAKDTMAARSLPEKGIQSLVPMDKKLKEMVATEVVHQYSVLPVVFGLSRPFCNTPRVKQMLFSRAASWLGVRGAMSPFFCEFTINSEVLPFSYPAVYAHELAHQLGVTSEAEANFYAYWVCTHSDAPALQFSGYFSLLFHLLNTAHQWMDAASYKQLLTTIHPGVQQTIRVYRAYWQKKYNPLIGKAQRTLYDLFLKANKIKSGGKNYAEVVGLVISYENWIKNR
ncbi:MAG: DUF3810 domain-containing protein [Bacteroidaceae bacterium]|nr:DUF3810 domain-containing protein [Bacteroidaceae bacterium]